MTQQWTCNKPYSVLMMVVSLVASLRNRILMRKCVLWAFPLMWQKRKPMELCRHKPGWFERQPCNDTVLACDDRERQEGLIGDTQTGEGLTNHFSIINKIKLGFFFCLHCLLQVLHMPWQLCCHGMCKNLQQFDNQTYKQIYVKFEYQCK